ncbi:hypothetical protein [Capnocytophaga sp.]|uniref:hypothetical protein n=1 Tax=Capnocytophaga sp. TaxID=44737 RepID=UPI0026DD4F72|nr:hypothetical protein [Capnocytophaga sp.]MDO5106595.1 hypothetical protein [Capnocytophaga sp.]
MGKIVEITDKYLKVEVPQKAVSGEVTLTFNGQTKVVATIKIQREYELYAYRRNYADLNNYIKELVKIDKNTGSQSTVANLDIEDIYFRNLIFDEQEKSIIGLTKMVSQNAVLVKVNLETGKNTKIPLSDITTIDFRELVKDNKGNFYSHRRNYTDDNNYLTQLVKININTGNQSVVANLDIDKNYFTDLVFNEQENNVIGLVRKQSNGSILLKVNLETGKNTKIPLSNTSSIDFDGLVKDNKGNFYAYRRDYTNMDNYITQLVKIDISTGHQSVVTNLDIEGSYFTDLVFDEQENSIIGFTKGQSNHTTLLKVNLETGKSTKIALLNVNTSNFDGLVFIPKQ